jgi:purine-cytosine permease-like protein
LQTGYEAGKLSLILMPGRSGQLSRTTGEATMAATLGAFLVSVLLMVLGIFLMIAAYSRKPLLLKIGVLGTMNIDPDWPGTRQRAIMFGVGVAFCAVGLLLVILEKLSALGLLARS